MTNYIEDVIWANQQTCTYHFHQWSKTNRTYALPRVEFYRAEPVKDLLKQARGKLDECARDAYDCSEFTVIIQAIDKFLEEK